MITRKIGHSHPLDIITKSNKTERGRMRKNNITLSLENIISFFRNITSHFTGKEKIITLLLIIIMLSFANITLCFLNSSGTSALSYSSNVGIGFTFNPTLSVNISSSDLVIPNLAPGTTNDSNTINVSVATNAAYGYTLSAIMNGNNSNLTHTNGTNVFSSIDTGANLSSLTTDNTWGYSYKLSNDTNWNNYSGLSNETNKTLIDSNDQTAIPIDFKIAAKAASTQASGTYTGTINFTAVTNPTPMNLPESYFAAGKTGHNGYYAMQDMTTEICNNTEVIGEGSRTQLIDLRDDKVYWATKLADGHCWMTQNLDLDIGGTGVTALTSENTDISTDSNVYTGSGIYSDYSVSNGIYTWNPDSTAVTSGRIVNYSNNSVSGWPISSSIPYSAEGGDTYFYTSDSTNNDTKYTSLSQCINYGHIKSDCEHFHVGNYYNWTAAVASNNSVRADVNYAMADNSICPKGWRLPIADSNGSSIYEFGDLLYAYDIIQTRTGYPANYQSGGFEKVRKSPLYFVRSGNIGGRNTLYFPGVYSYYWSSAVSSGSGAYHMEFSSNDMYPAGIDDRVGGRSVRCLAR